MAVGIGLRMIWRDRVGVEASCVDTIWLVVKAASWICSRVCGQVVRMSKCTTSEDG